MGVLSHTGSAPGTVLITGGTGLIGRALTARYLELGAQVHTAQRGISADGAAAAISHQLDITDQESVSDLVKALRPDLIVHLAALSDVTYCAAAPETADQVIVAGTRNVLAAATRHHPEAAVVHASSIRAYGSESASPIAEHAPLAAGRGYGAAKARADRLVENAAGQGLRTAVLRASNVYGPHDPAVGRIVPSLVSAALESRAAVLRGSPDVVLDLLHVADAVDAYVALAGLLLAEHTVRTPPAVNAGSGKGVSIRQLATVVERITGRLPALKGPPDPAPPGPSRVLDIALARDVLGWAPGTDLDTGMESVICAARPALAGACRG